jgi:hypothetical protein
MNALRLAALFPGAFVIASVPFGAQVKVVNIVPYAQSGEASPDPEPSISINPRDAKQLVIGSITWGEDVCQSRKRAPLFVSYSGGDRWGLSCVIPLDEKNADAGDFSLKFGSDGALYMAMLFPLTPPPTLRVLSTTTAIGPDPMKTLLVRQMFDQPWLDVVARGGTTRLLVVGNDKTLMSDNSAAGTGVALVSRDSAGATVFQRTQLEHRQLMGQNYSVRVAAHPDGTAYVVFYSPLADNPDGTFDVTVSRDDSAGTSAHPFAAIHEPALTSGPQCSRLDGKIGVRVARCIHVPFNAGLEASFGQERRVAANVSIAVDPRNSRTVYVAWADSSGGLHYALHVRRSTDGGATWGKVLITIPNATNPALAVDSAGSVGFLFQQLLGLGPLTQWNTRLLVSDDAFVTTRSFTLAATPASDPLAQITPYIGDYDQLVALGDTFYGAFSASNAPDSTHFPNGVVFQRRADFSSKRLLNTGGQSTVPISIDPYFFRVGPGEATECSALRAHISVGATKSLQEDRARAGDIGCRLGRDDTVKSTKAPRLPSKNSGGKY